MSGSHGASRPDPLQTIIINEIMADPSFDFNGDGTTDYYDEFIELYNPTNNPISLDNCTLDDIEIGGSSPYLISGSSVPPFSHILFFRNETKIALNNNGEERVRLLNPEGADMDNLTYFETESNRSWARRGDGNPYWTMPRENTPGSSNPTIPLVVINEFLVKPHGSSTDEWIELYNADPRDVNMTGWTLGDIDGNSFVFPEFIIQHDDYVCVNIGASGGTRAGEHESGKQFYMDNPNQVLTDSGDDILLCDDIGLAVDYVNYGNGTSIDGCPEELEFDLPPLTSDKGKSLAMIPNGKITDSGSFFEVMNGTNITKGWNNSLPLALEFSADVGVNLEGEGGLVDIPIRNPCAAPSLWDITVNVSMEGFAASIPESLFIEAGTEKTVPLEITIEDGLLPGASTIIAINFTSGLVPAIQYRLDVHAVVSADVVINEIMIDPPGADSSADEWIELLNKDHRVVDMNGWMLFAKTGDISDIFQAEPVFTFPEMLLLPEELVLVHSINGIDEQDFSPLARHLYANDTNLWANSRGSVALVSPACTGMDFIRWGDTEDVPVLPDRFEGSCPAPKSGESIARLWDKEDNDNATDFYIPEKTNITPGLDNGQIHSFSMEGLPTVNVVEPGITVNYDIRLINTGNLTTKFQINSTWKHLETGGAEMNGQNSLWEVVCSNSSMIMVPGENNAIAIAITPPETVDSLAMSGVDVEIVVYPMEDPWRKIKITSTFQMPVVDLVLSELRLEGDWSGMNTVEQGAIVKLKIKLTNQGPVNSSGVDVALYVDSINEANLMARKHYESIPGMIYSSTRNPSFTIDTLLYPGNHSYLVILEHENVEAEMNIENDKQNLTLNVTPVKITEAERAILITEFYYYSYIEDELDEYIEIYNPGDETVDISGWQLTHDAASELEDGIFFPPGTLVTPKQYLLIAHSAEELDKSAGIAADLDVINGGICPDMEAGKASWINMKDYSGQIVLRTAQRLVVDNVVYGREELSKYGWNGTGVPRCARGYICRRNSFSGRMPDTNTSLDFNSLKAYPLGGSDLSPFDVAAENVEIIFYLPRQEEFMSQLIENAVDEILLMSEKLESNLTFRLVLDAAGRGVNVKILLEGKPFGGISDRQRYYCSLLHEAGAFIYYMDEELKEAKLNRYSNIGAAYVVVDGKKALLQTAPFDSVGAPSKGMRGVKGMGLILAAKGATFLKEAFITDLNLSKRDITAYDLNHSTFGGLDEDYLFKPGEKEGGIYYDLPASLSGPVSGVTMGLYPDISHPLNCPEEEDNDIIKGAITGAKEYIYLVTENIEPLAEVENPGMENLILPHVEALLEAAGRGIKVRVLLDIHDTEMLFSALESDENISGSRAVARWLTAEAEKRNAHELEVRYDYLDGATGISGTMMLIDNASLLLSSASIEYENLYLNREWAVMIDGNNWGETYDLLDYWWDRSIPMERKGGDIASSFHGELLITEVYYNSPVSYKPDQYVKITNQGTSRIDMSWWRLSDKQGSANANEGTVIFPVGTMIDPGDSIVLARKADAYAALMNSIPDFEYEADTDKSVPNLMAIKNIPVFVPLWDEIFLISKHGLLVDAVVYGKSEYAQAGWEGTQVSVVSSGDLLMRKKDAVTGAFLDTNGSGDFSHLRPFRPGQSSFVSRDFEINGNVTTYVSPDSSYEVLMEMLSTAKRTLFLNIYQFHNPYLLDRIVNLSKDGVDVKVLLEGGPVGGVTDYQKYVSMKLNESGAHVRYMISNKAEGLGARYNYDHAKYLVIDNKTLILQSENFVTTGVPVNSSYGNRGWGVVVEDVALARYFSDVFFHDFNPNMRDTKRYEENHSSYGKPPEDLDMSYHVRKGNYMSRFSSVTVDTNVTITPVLSPDTSSSPENSIISMMEDARSYIKIEQLDCDIAWKTGAKSFNWSDPENYYLEFPDGEHYYNLYLKAAVDAARRGVNVNILLDSAFVWDWAKREDNSDTVYYINKIAELEKLDMEASLVSLRGASGRASLEKVHNKGVIVDGEKVLVSSINWGATSVLKNREAGLIISNREIARYYEQIFDFDWNLSVFNYISPYVIYSGNRTLAPGGSTQVRVALTYLNTTIPVTVRFNCTSRGPLEVELSHKEMRIYPRESQELDLSFQASEEAEPGTTCRITVTIEILNRTQDFLFFDVNITRKEDEKKVSGEDSFFDSVKNMITIVLVAFVILLVAVGRDFIIRWQDNRQRGGKEKGKLGEEAVVKEKDVEEDLEDGQKIEEMDAGEAEKTEQVEKGITETEEGTYVEDSLEETTTGKRNAIVESGEGDDEKDNDTKNEKSIDFEIE